MAGDERRRSLFKQADSTSGILAYLNKDTFVDITGIYGLYGKAVIDGNTGYVSLLKMNYCGSSDGDGISSLRVTSLPYKTSYVDGEEEFDASGLAVSALNADGTAKEISGYTVVAPEMKGPGTKTVTVRYSAPGYTAVHTVTFNVTVTRVPLKALVITSLPDKTSYIEGQTPDLTGLTVKAVYSDGRADRTFTAAQMRADSDFTLTSCHGEAAGSPIPSAGVHTIKISYKYDDITAEFALNAVAKTLTGIEITKAPGSTEIYEGQTPSFAGMVVSALYDNGLSSPVTDYKVSYDTLKVGANTVTVAYGGFSRTFTLTVKALVMTGLKINPPSVTSYLLGSKADFDDMTVYAVYNSGEEKLVTDYTVSVPDMNKLGKQTVTVSYGGQTAEFTINITASYLKGDIDLDGSVTAADARLALRAAIDLDTLKGIPLLAADVDSDNAVTAADARLILRAAIELEILK